MLEHITVIRYALGMDWKKLILEIQAKHGLSQPQIAKICGCGQATISDLVNENTKEPRHSLGQALVKLLAKRAVAVAL